MRWTDLLATSLASLRQRLFRTSLTVLGVLIGTTSVIVMVSLGVGLSSSFTSQFQQISLRQVSVNSVPPPEMAAPGQPAQLSGDLIPILAAEPGVRAVWPTYLVDVEFTVGAATQYFQVVGLPAEALQEMNLDLAWGQLPQPGEALGLVLGDLLHTQLWDPVTGMPLEVDFRSDTIFGAFATFGEYGPVPIGGGEDGDDPTQPAKPPKRIIMPAVAQIANPGNDQWGPYSSSVFADFDALRKAMEKAMPGKALPNQPATADGKPKGKAFIYTEIRLLTDSPEDAEMVLNSLREQGYGAFADVEWIRQAQSQALMIQAVFGGIGFVSLLVAAIGIANTMMMSVYERTKEIGIMKVMGAALGDIRRMFLIESAAIGFLGGVIGLVLSLAASALLNATLGAQVAGEGGSGELSVVPAWLMVGAVVFATLIGTLAGLVPAQRATNLSPLAAMRAE
ncbi:ABC transporter permease [Tessaracoccus sp. MC1627]|uniref:ABC transporter permease n=1 Tax=Tessaracoccus sp. MC1627 TaxID=2760312 RepID=UPI001603BDB3|nr:FtsX-like permease family protein [Tessaracoccus sp. MC1627]MBB1511909.1 ABC transporter permease [Tessaracoccus sp. MC1627]